MYGSLPCDSSTLSLPLSSRSCGSSSRGAFSPKVSAFDNDSQPGAEKSLYESEAVCLPITDGKGEERLIWIHAWVLDQIPYFRALRARWTSGEQCRANLHCHCTHAGLKALVCRLYSQRSWHALDWVARSAAVVIEVAFQADMWGLESMVAEVVTALKLAMINEPICNSVRDVLQGRELPNFLQFFKAKQCLALQMSDCDICSMLMSAASSSSETTHRATQRIIELHRLDGRDCKEPICDALQSRSLVVGVSSEEFTTQNPRGNTSTNNRITRAFRSNAGFAWLCGLLMQDVEIMPDHFLRARDTLQRGRREYACCSRDDQCSLTSETEDVIAEQFVRLLEIGAHHVLAERMSSTVFTEIDFEIVQFSDRLSGAIIAALPDGIQVRLAEGLGHSQNERTSWANFDRLQALRGEARGIAALHLVKRIGNLNQEVLELIMSELDDFNEPKTADRHPA